MLADMIGSMLLIFVVLAFYRLFKDVDKELAVSSAGALMAAQGPTFLAAFDKRQQDALVMFFVELHEHQITAAEILWGACTSSRCSSASWRSCYGS